MSARENAEHPENANDAQRTPSEQQWLRVNAYLQRNRYELAVRAAEDYPSGARVAGTPLIAASAWRPAAPIPLRDVRLEFRPDAAAPAGLDAAAPAGSDAAAVAPELMPRRADGIRYPRYTDVVQNLAAPAIF